MTSNVAPLLMSHAELDLVGIGVDLVEIPRFSEFLGRNGQSLNEVFTASELDAANPPNREVWLATRWGLKEAVLKALGTGWGAGVAWTDVEAGGALLAPEVQLRGAAKKRAEAAGARVVRASVAHAGPCVIAVAMLLRHMPSSGCAG